MPSAARRALGLDSTGLAAVPAPRAAAEVDVSYPDSPADAVRNASQLWPIDLNDSAALEQGKAGHRAWTEASLRWRRGISCRGWRWPRPAVTGCSALASWTR